jgi:8-oxo-dGTP pyrophosphatase MutT (NUDIX family)
MKALYALYIYAGRLAWPIQLPLMRLFIKRTHRVYVVIYDGNEVLLTKNWLGDNRYALPGGGVAGSESNEEALKRELEEEIGVDLDVTKIKHAASGKWQTHGLGFDYDIYTHNSRITSGRIRRLEIVEVAWVKKTKLSEQNIAKEILEVVNVL